jgi:CBS domain-containing protein
MIKKTIKQLLERKGTAILTIGPNDSVYNAIKSMADHHIGSLLVMENEQLVGIITERDYSRNVVLKGKSSSNTPVKDVMTTNVLCTNPDQTIDEAMALMTDKRVRHLPVIDKGNLIGIISIGDLVKTIISEQQFIIKQLEHYING